MKRETRFEIDVDGEKITAYKGETVAAALTAADKRIFNHTVEGNVQGLYCGIGLCWNCLMEIDGVDPPGLLLKQLSAGAGWVPVRNRDMQTTVHRVYAVGDCAGVAGRSATEYEGRLAGIAA